MASARLLPRATAVVVVSLAGIGMGLRDAWPGGAELVTFGITVACLYAVVRAGSMRVRAGAAAVWVMTVVWVSGSMVPPQVGVDFKTFADGATLLFDEHRSPYHNAGTTAFPFPTFAVVRALSMNGRLSVETTAWVFFFLQASLLALSFAWVRALMVREGRTSSSDLPLGLVQFGLLVHPAVMLALYYGQSSILAGALLVAALWVWRCRAHGLWPHAAAVLVNLAWMVKPQLLMAAGYFVFSWLWRFRRGEGARPPEAVIGRLIGPWCIVLILTSLALDPPGYAAAYRDFIDVAASWHTQVASVSSNNYAIPAIVAKAGARYGAWSVSGMVHALTLLAAGLVLTLNLMSLRVRPSGTLNAFLPWWLASLLWTSLVWRFYLSLVVAGLLLLAVSELKVFPTMVHWRALWLAVGIGSTMVFSSFVFSAGLVLLYLLSLELLADPAVSSGEASALSGVSSMEPVLCPGPRRTLTAQ